MTKLDKKLLIALIIINLYVFIIDLLRILNVMKLTDHDAQLFNIIFSLIASTGILLFVKNKYWIIAGIFGMFHTTTRIVAAFLFTAHGSIYPPILGILILGLICTLISGFYYYKLLKLNFTFDGHLRLDDLDAFLKKTFRSDKQK